MFAVIETGGKQYRVEKGDTLDVELLDDKAGKKVELNKVLLISKQGKVEIGKPYVKGAKVHGKILDNVKDKKVVCFKYKSKKNYRRTLGHRQRYSRVQIEKIEA